MIEAGKHRARAAEWSFGLTKTGKEQIGVLFDLLDQAGEQITWYGYFTEKTLATTTKALRALGWVGVDLSDLGDLSQAEVTLTVEHETDDNGTLRARVRWVNGVGGLAMKEQIQGAELKSFADRMRGAIAALDPSEAKKTAAKPAAPRPAPKPVGSYDEINPPPGDDLLGDLPF